MKQRGYFGRIKDAVFGARGKDQTDSGGWVTLYGTDIIKPAGEIFKTYTKAEKEQIAKNHDVVFACIWKIALAFTEATLEAVKKNADGEFEVVDDPIVDLLMMPNPFMSFEAFSFVTTAHLISTGESWLWEVRDSLGNIVELYPIPASWIREVTKTVVNEQGQRVEVLDYYEIRSTTGRDPLRARPEDLTRSYIPDPTNPLQACGPLQAASKAYQMDEEATAYLGEMLINLKLPGPIMKRKEPWNEPDKAAVRELFSEKFGKGRRGLPMFMSGEGAILEYLFPLKDLDWPGLYGLKETRICAVLGVPPITINLRSGLERSTYENADQANKGFYRQTMRAWWKIIPAGWTRGLIWSERGTREISLRFNTEDVFQLQEDETALSERILNQVKTGIVTRGQAQEALGYEKDEKRGDVYLMPLTIVEIPANEEPIAESIEAPDTLPPEDDEE